MCIYEHVYGWGWVNVISITVSEGGVRRPVFQEGGKLRMSWCVYLLAFIAGEKYSAGTALNFDWNWRDMSSIRCW